MIRTAKAKTIESISVRQFYETSRKSLRMELIAGAAGLTRVIQEKSLNRPALALIGHFKYFGSKRIQLFGAGEMAFIWDLAPDEQRAAIKRIAEHPIPCIVISNHNEPPLSLTEIAEERNIPVFRTPLTSKNFSVASTLLLEELFAPTITVHGTLLDIQGVGTLICGESGVGKSECALALIERGHSLVSDDITYIKLLNDNELMGSSSEINRGYMECRGIGIINIAELFGIRAVRLSKRLDLIVNFKNWKPELEEERTGLERHFEYLLDQAVPTVEIPVRPGRDMARLVEVATMVHSLRLLGHDSAREFNQRLIAKMTENKS
jgi:HPr kinase/phosphorylase